MEDGPYVGTTIFETANRVLSDLVVFAAADLLLRHPLPGLPSVKLTDVEVALGVAGGYDIVSHPPTGPTVVGECFNVARSFFQAKLASSKRKLQRDDQSHLVIAFNQEAVRDPRRWNEMSDSRWSYLAIDLGSWIRKKAP